MATAFDIDTASPRQLRSWRPEAAGASGKGAGVRPTPLVLRTADGVALAGRWWPAEPQRDAIVLVHGFTSSRTDRRVTELARALHGDGLAVLTYDARGHGHSGGECTLGDREMFDVGAAVAAARGHADRVVVVGESMGAIAALRWAARDRALDGVVCVSCPATWRLPRSVQGVLAAGITHSLAGRALAALFLGVRVGAPTSRPDPALDLVRLVSAPLAVIHGRRDRFIDCEDAVALHEAADKPCRLEIVESARHGYGPAMVDAVQAAVGWALGEASLPQQSSLLAVG